MHKPMHQGSRKGSTKVCAIPVYLNTNHQVGYTTQTNYNRAQTRTPNPPKKIPRKLGAPRLLRGVACRLWRLMARGWSRLGGVRCMRVCRRGWFRRVVRVVWSVGGVRSGSRTHRNGSLAREGRLLRVAPCVTSLGGLNRRLVVLCGVIMVWVVMLLLGSGWGGKCCVQTFVGWCFSAGHVTL